MNTAIEAAKFLIQLFSSTKYECNRQKLQKLILFAHFALLLDGKDGFLHNENVSASNIGLGIDSVSKEYYILKFNGINENTTITNYIKKSNSEFLPSFQYDEASLPYFKIEVLIKVFESFGAYDSVILSEVTRNLELYPADTDFTRYPDNTIFIENCLVIHFISELRNEYGEGYSGIEVMTEKVGDIITAILPVD